MTLPGARKIAGRARAAPGVRDGGWLAQAFCGLRSKTARIGPAVCYSHRAVPLYRRAFTPGHLQFITTSTYRRTPLFRSERFAQTFVEVPGDLRCEFKFSLIAWVLMPEHFHTLPLPQPAESTSEVVKQLKQRTAFRILAALKERGGHPWAEGILQRLSILTITFKR